MRIIIVFGGENKFDGATKARFIKAIAIPAEIIIFSGHKEANLMANAYYNNYPFAFEYDQAVIEDRATNTRENLQFSFGLIKNLKFNKLILASSWYHLPRIFLVYQLIKTNFKKSSVKIKLVPAWNLSIDVFLEPVKILVDLLDCFGLVNFHRFLTNLKYKFYNRKSRL